MCIRDRYSSGIHDAFVTEAQEKGLEIVSDAVSYTHLDVYKRQLSVMRARTRGVTVETDGSFSEEMTEVQRQCYDCLLYTSRCV